LESSEYTKALKILRPAAEQGNADAQYLVASAYRDGNGVKQNSSLALHWFRRAAERGHAGAQKSLGLIYDQGIGVSGSVAKAEYWYRRAAKQGNAEALYRLGQFYSEERVFPDANLHHDVVAYILFSLAVERGHPTAADSRVAKDLMSDRQLAIAEDRIGSFTTEIESVGSYGLSPPYRLSREASAEEPSVGAELREFRGKADDGNIGRIPAEGVQVLAMAPNGPAAKAGLATGDLITHVDWQPVYSPEGVQAIVGRKAIGEVIEFVVWFRNNNNYIFVTKVGDERKLDSYERLDRDGDPKPNPDASWNLPEGTKDFAYGRFGPQIDASEDHYLGRCIDRQESEEQVTERRCFTYDPYGYHSPSAVKRFCGDVTHVNKVNDYFCVDRKENVWELSCQGVTDYVRGWVETVQCRGRTPPSGDSADSYKERVLEPIILNDFEDISHGVYRYTASRVCGC